MLLREPVIPGVPLFAGVWRDEGDVKTAPEQFDFGLWLVIPVTTLPRPWLAGSRLLRRHHDAASLPLRRVAHRKLLRVWSLKRCNGKAGFIHDVVVTVKAVVPGCLFAVEGNVRLRPARHPLGPETCAKNRDRQQGGRR